MSVTDWISRRVDLGTADGRKIPRTPDTAELPPWEQMAERRRRLKRMAQAVAIAMLAAAILAGLVWNARAHYERGLAALASEQYSAAAQELSAARILFFSYGDSEALAATARARAAVASEAAARLDAQRQRELRLLDQAGARLTADDAAGTLAALRKAAASPVWLQDDESVARALALAERLRIAARDALDERAWKRAGTLAAALLVLRPGDAVAETLAADADTGARLTATLDAARAAARRGDWRTALRLALRVSRAQVGFPGAARLVAQARAALRPAPAPAEPEPAAPVTSPSPTAAPPPAPSAPAPPPP